MSAGHGDLVKAIRKALQADLPKQVILTNISLIHDEAGADECRRAAGRIEAAIWQKTNQARIASEQEVTR